MILRALFWIGLVALLMPHEPDLGLGRPAAPADSLVSGVSSALKQPKSCDGAEAACFAALGLLDRLKLSGLHGLAQVKSDIEDAERVRTARGG
jgi:hypothetical protein